MHFQNNTNNRIEMVQGIKYEDFSKPQMASVTEIVEPADTRFIETTNASTNKIIFKALLNQQKVLVLNFHKSKRFQENLQIIEPNKIIGYDGKPVTDSQLFNLKINKLKIVSTPNKFRIMQRSPEEARKIAIRN